mgnify:CR=1 FL=1|jgi:hypothetical protein
MKINNITLLALTVAFAVPVSSAIAKEPKMSALQIQQMQTKDVEVNKGIAFSSVMTVLQDSGYRIGSADKDTGLITGVASTNTKTTWLPFVGFGKSKKTPVVSAFIEEIGPEFTKIRLNFVMTKVSANGFGGGEDETPILDPQVYQDAFEKIDQAIFVRQSMVQSATPKAASEPAVQSPAAESASPN